MNKIYILYEIPYEGTFVEILMNKKEAENYCADIKNNKPDIKILFIIEGKRLRMDLSETYKLVQTIKYKTVKLEVDEDGKCNTVSPDEASKF
jgi:hypothetical protein